MKVTNKEFKANLGEVLHLDHVYKWMGLLPNDSYEHIDVEGNSCDAGDEVRFLKRVRITVTIKVQ